MSIQFASFAGEEFEPEELVRKFSLSLKDQAEDGVEEMTEIEKAIVEDFDVKEKRRKDNLRRIEEYLETTKPQELSELDRKRKSLELALQEFLKSVQNQYPDDTSPKFDSWEDVTEVVQKMIARLEQKQSKGKFRRATKHLRSFCNTVKYHSTALKMLPTNNEYVSVFYGALATTIQASENYTNIMEALPQALADINDAVSAIEKRLWLFDSDAMKGYAWRMYSQIFNLLGVIIRWYTQRSYQRLISSFNEHLPELIQDQVDEIQKSAQLIHQEAHLRSQADTRISRLYVEGIDKKVDRLILEIRERDQRNRSAERQDYERFWEMMNEIYKEKFREDAVLKDTLEEVWAKFRRGRTGFAVAEILEDQAREDPKQRKVQYLESGSLDSLSDVEEQSSTSQSALETAQPKPPEITRDFLLTLSADMEAYFDRNQVQIFDDDLTSSFYADSDIVSRIQSWATSTQSNVLYIAGMDCLPDDHSLSRIAAYYAYESRSAKIPVCSYFCQLSNEEPPAGRTRETIELTALAYSLLRQLIELLPSRPGNLTALDDLEIFSELEGTLVSFPKALELLDSLLSALDYPIIIFVIDGLDQLDDLTFGSTDKWLHELVEVLLRHGRDSSTGVKKMMFSTGGSSAPLFEALDASEILVVNAPQTRRGRRSIGEEPLVI